VRGAGAGSSRPSNISLNLTPFVDMMTILVTFLLMVFSTAGEFLHAQKGLELPVAEMQAALQQAPIITVTKTEITFNGNLMATVDSALREDTFRIEALFERLEGAAKEIHELVQQEKVSKDVLKACEDHKNGKRPEKGKPICPRGLAILQADQQTDARLINKVVLTAKQAGFDNLLFAVKNKK